MPSDKAGRDPVESRALERSSVEGSIVASLCKTLVVVVGKSEGKRRERRMRVLGSIVFETRDSRLVRVEYLKGSGIGPLR